MARCEPAGVSRRHWLSSLLTLLAPTSRRSRAAPACSKPLRIGLERYEIRYYGDRGSAPAGGGIWGRQRDGGGAFLLVRLDPASGPEGGAS